MTCVETVHISRLVSFTWKYLGKLIAESTQLTWFIILFS